MREKFERKSGSLEDKVLNYLIEDISKYPPLNDSDIKDLVFKMKKGCKKSFDKLINHNIRFVIKVAKKYRNQGVPYLDLIEAGITGLIHSAHKYEYNEETKFLSYAVWWIKQNIRKELTNMSRIFRIPPCLVSKIQEVNKKIEDGESLTGSEALFYMQMQPTSSLDAPISDNDQEDSQLTLMDIISEEVNLGEVSLDFEEIANLLKEEIEDILNDREKMIIKEYFGFTSGEVRSLEDVGLDLGVSKERVRIIKNRALYKLKCSKKIREYYKNNSVTVERFDV